ncbi:LysM domain-containing protein [Micromonospora nigra]|uniref:LysM domain-containing protein n=1 Tax=Micromonospora nigra TaxID=145857 RepID=A0A1C6S2S6_9ACTN|nr:LysM peptidoglycan-binding domain-containing protein [Micromonospora nigra]SCL23800.1 LysM domain-containing protein [Micromonospora nigra]
MAASGRSPLRRTGHVLTGLGALVVLAALLVGGPVALLALAGNPLPDHVPTLAEAGSTLTSRDDGQLFLRALALAGWFGWATFALSVLVELGAQVVRRPAPRLPGMGRQQRAAAALVGSVALILAASPVAASAATLATTPGYAPAMAAPPAVAGPAMAAPPAAVGPVAAGPLTAGPAVAMAATPPASDAPVYRVARGDYLGEIADRYLDDFDDYRQLAAMNRLDDPDRIRPGQLLALPAEADDQGARRHATGRLVTRAEPRPAPEQATPRDDATRDVPENHDGAQEAPTEVRPGESAPHPDEPPAQRPAGDHPLVTVGAARAGEPDRVNRPLAVSAVLAVASIVGAQIGAVLGLRRRPTAAVAPTTQVRAQQHRELPAGRHRRD